MKKCTACGCEKPFAAFYKQAGCRDGVRPDCKECVRGRAVAWVKANPEKKKSADRAYRAANKSKVNAGKKAWNAANKEKMSAWEKAWREANPGRMLARTKKWAANNPGKVSAKRARRRAAELQATPSWAIDFFIEEAYALAKLRTEMFGFAWHVDHVVPLRSKLVCGLHTHDNLQVIPATDNIVKGNRHWPDMP